MKQAILRLYDYLSAHRPLVWLLLATLLALFLLSARRMAYQEDISAFLPRDAEAERYADIYQRLGGQDKVAVFFETCTDGDDSGTERIIEAMDSFAGHWTECDSLGWVDDLQVSVDGGSIREVFSFITENEPYFLTQADYARMDSLLAQPDYIATRLDAVRQSLYAPGSALSSAWLRSDPLALFSPVLSRLGELNPMENNRMEDGYVFTTDGRAGVLFFTSPFGGSESALNAELSRLVDEVAARVGEDCPGVRVFATGGPLVAAGNASRIKKDSLLAVAIALLLIALVLWLSFRRFSDVLWIAVTILFGAAFALGVLALLKPSISIIILGIGSMIIGIAVNYPLHYVDHLKYQRDKRKTLADQINPLLVGNITTVGAFLSLLLLKADALHDFGLMGALMLAGTILFVLIFLPVLVPEAPGERRTIKLDWDRHLDPSRRVRRITFACFLILTGVFFVLSRNISFDADMHNINYMTADQRHGFDLLEQLGESRPGYETVYVVSQAASADEALAGSERLQPLLQACGAPLRSISPLLPSLGEQERRLSAWDAFLARHPDLAVDLQREARARGFAPAAFTPFLDLLEKQWTPRPAEWFEPLTRSAGSAMYLPGEDLTSVVSYLLVPGGEAEACKAGLREHFAREQAGGSFCFNAADVSGRLVSALSLDFDKIGLLCSLIVFFFLWFSFRRIELSVLSFLPLAVGWVWILGVMQLLDLRFNIVNIILATFIFGQGDDYTIFITEGLMYEYACGKKILRSYKNCVMLSALIMLIGIGALIVARHPAMKSLAQVTIIGMFTVVVMAWYLPPLVFRWLTRRKGQVRDVPLTFLRLLRTGYILLMFALAMLLFSLGASLSFLFGKDSERRRLRYHKAIQRLARVAVRAIPGTHYTLHNPLGEDFSKPAIYVCNHQSHFDVLALLALQPRLVFMTNEWAWKFYGPVIRRAEFYPASYGLEKSSEHMKSLMARGYSVAIFPEGTRSTDCSIQRFHRGAFLAARELGLDILPLYIHGFGYALPKHEFLLRKADLSMEVGARIRVPDGDIAAFTRAMRHHYQQEYERIRLCRETAAYNAPYVRYQYLYKGVDAMRECSDVLRKADFGAIDAIGDDVRTIAVEGSGFGAYALLLALSHRNKEVYAYETDEEKYLTAVRCSGVPANLHHILATESCGRVAADLILKPGE
ncbi:MAG: 1-acyl-sn-glycerol-3-phosphate acyltransferase [Bacteroidales bacterium]|nr:1-acyl-sn-glycerol-3-phosphate acyltransferase [Bacteroidales bacterium]